MQHEETTYPERKKIYESIQSFLIFHQLFYANAILRV
jgi:hypothetical protein